MRIQCVTTRRGQAGTVRREDRGRGADALHLLLFLAVLWAARVVLLLFAAIIAVVEPNPYWCLVPALLFSLLMQRWERL